MQQNTAPEQKKCQTLSKSEGHKDDGEGSDTKERKKVYGKNRTKETGGHKKRDTHTKKKGGGRQREKKGNPEIVRNTSKHRELNTKYWVEVVGGIGGIF